MLKGTIFHTHATTGRCSCVFLAGSRNRQHQFILNNNALLCSREKYMNFLAGLSHLLSEIFAQCKNYQAEHINTLADPSINFIPQ